MRDIPSPLTRSNIIPPRTLAAYACSLAATLVRVITPDDREVSLLWLLIAMPLLLLSVPPVAFALSGSLFAKGQSCPTRCRACCCCCCRKGDRRRVAPDDGGEPGDGTPLEPVAASSDNE